MMVLATAVVLGCMDPNTTNYNANANTDDGSCIAAMVNLFFSEYAEGSSNNKYFEIYNPTLDTVYLSDYACQVLQMLKYSGYMNIGMILMGAYMAQVMYIS